MPMSPTDALIYNHLKTNPGHAYITPDGKELYALTEGGMLCWTGVDFGELSAEEVNLYIQESLKKQFNL